MNFKPGDKVIYQGQPAVVIDTIGVSLKISLSYGVKLVSIFDVTMDMSSQSSATSTSNTSSTNTSSTIFYKGDSVYYQGQRSVVIDVLPNDYLLINTTKGYVKVSSLSVTKIDKTNTSDSTGSSLSGSNSSEDSKKLSTTTGIKRDEPTLVKEKVKGKPFPVSGSIPLEKKNLVPPTIVEPPRIPKAPKSILSNDSIKEVSVKIAKKPILISRAELKNLGKDIKLVSYNPLQGLISDQGKPFTPRLLNWVEPYEILGEDKTLFYTEFNSGLKVGDRVFILNGNYDSDDLIQIDKYKKGRDGYKVLFIDQCKVVLDIDYTGVLPYLDEPIDEFIKVYYIRSLQEFLHANRQVTTGTGQFEYKYNYYQNNIAFIDTYYTTYQNWGRNGGMTSSSGFFVRNGITQSWTDITYDLISNGTYSFALSPTYSNNNRIKVLNGDFTFNGKTFREGYVYKWNVGPTQSEWIVDVKYFKPFLSKTNFRSGNFNGKWNTGLFGSFNQRITWDGNKSSWKSGTLLNTTWKKGTFESLYTLADSYFASIDEYGLPYQKINVPNNNGKGFNLIVDSDIETSTINNGSIINSVLGTGTVTFSVVENHLLNTSTTYPNTVKKAVFENCEFNNSYISNSELKNIRTNNSKFENVKSVNSYFRNSVFYNSNYNSDNIIKILGYDELNANEFPSSTSTFSVGGSFESKNSSSTIVHSYQKVYKFYINESSYNRLKTGDEFYLKNIKLNNNSKEILNIFDKKFRVGTWIDYIDDYNMFTNSFYKRPIDVAVFLSTPRENSYLFESVRKSITGYGDIFYTSVYGKNSNNLYSIDIWISLHDYNEQSSGFITKYFPQLYEYLDINTISPSTYSVPAKYDYISATSSGPDKIGNIVDISDAYIVDSDFDSGIFENSNWNNGNFSNSHNDLNITLNNAGLGGLYALSFTQSKSILASSDFNPAWYPENKYNLQQGNVVFLDAVDFYDGTNTIRIPDAYKVTANNLGTYIIEEVVAGTISQIISLSQSIGTFSTLDANNRYGYIKTLKIKNSKIKNGILRRPYIVNSIIETDNYDTLDKDYTDLVKARSLVVTDLLSSNKNNKLSSATYLYSSFNGGNDLWNKGIIQNSIWNSGTFSSGVIKESTWKNGVFTGGLFYNSRSFNSNPNSDYQYYDTDRIRTYWKSGLTNDNPYLPIVGITLSNNRFSWQNGQFIDGEFYKSDWEGGTFSGGKFWSSKWYNGTFVNGTIGSYQVSEYDTLFYNGLIKLATVDNASIIAKDTSYLGLSSSQILWENGTFNKGLFSVDIDRPAKNYATWSNGSFNDGQFTSMAEWKYGTFNGGKFASFYGWTQSDSITQSHYGWQDGIFNGGEFGNANGLTNSIWYTGEFNGGLFKGRVWNYGIFLYGEFKGSGVNPVSGLTCANASDFVDSYSYSYWGKWRNGIVTDTKDRLIKDKKTKTITLQASVPLARRKPAKITNALWQTGTFSHPNASIEESVWLDGAFERGKFLDGSFNPYVKRNGATTSSFNFNDDTCYWENGYFNNGDFYISIWKEGNFDVGTATGMIWENGIANYMNAYNVFWEDGTWRNGNWNGSVWDFNSFVTEDYVRQILFRGMSWSGTSSCHVWNVFLDNSYTAQTLQISATQICYTSGSPTRIVAGVAIGAGDLGQPVGDFSNPIQLGGFQLNPGLNFDGF